MDSKHHFLIPALCLSIALAACAPAEDASGDDTANGDAATEAEAVTQSARDMAMTGSGWLTIGGDGAVQTTFLDPDGRYRDLRNGAFVAGGSWERRTDGRVCFEPDQGLGACWEIGSVEEDGSAIATDGGGKRVLIKQIGYIAPEPADEDVIEDAEGAA